MSAMSKQTALATRTAAALRALADAVEEEDILVSQASVHYSPTFNKNGCPVVTNLNVALRHPDATQEITQVARGLVNAFLDPNP